MLAVGVGIVKKKTRKPKLVIMIHDAILFSMEVMISDLVRY